MNKLPWPKPATPADDDEGDRQMLLLAIAELALRRPGWNWTLGRLAERLHGRAEFEEFKRIADDTSTRETEWFAFLARKYVQRADERQKLAGLQYTEAETHDLAKESARFEAARLSL